MGRGKKLKENDFANLFLMFKKGARNEAIELRYGYSRTSIERFRKFYKAVLAKDYDSIRRDPHISTAAKLWAMDNGFLPGVTLDREATESPNETQPDVPVQLEVNGKPAPESAPDYTLAGMDAIWNAIGELNKTLDTMTNSLVFALDAINKGIDKLAERWQ